LLWWRGQSEGRGRPSPRTHFYSSPSPSWPGSTRPSKMAARRSGAAANAFLGQRRLDGRVKPGHDR
jgi:hypothetical protein